MRASRADVHRDKDMFFVHYDHSFKLIECKRHFYYFVSSNRTTCADLQRYLNYRKLNRFACSSTNINLSQEIKTFSAFPIKEEM